MFIQKTIQIKNQRHEISIDKSLLVTEKDIYITAKRLYKKNIMKNSELASELLETMELVGKAIKTLNSELRQKIDELDILNGELKALQDRQYGRSGV